MGEQTNKDNLQLIGAIGTLLAAGREQLSTLDELVAETPDDIEQQNDYRERAHALSEAIRFLEIHQVVLCD